MNIFRGISELECDAPKQQMQAVSNSIMDNLKRRRMQAKDSLEKLDAAIKAMEANPQVTEVLELIAKV